MFKKIKTKHGGDVDCSGNLCTRNLKDSRRKATDEGNGKCDSADTGPHNFYCPKFNYDAGDCEGFVSAEEVSAVVGSGLQY